MTFWGKIPVPDFFTCRVAIIMYFSSPLSNPDRPYTVAAEARRAAIA